MASVGNAVVAEWTGPTGMQLFDGTVLTTGSVIRGIGKDEAEGSAYWKVLGDLDSYTGEAQAETGSHRSDWSFGVEEGGAGTGRPLTDTQAALQPKPASKKAAASTATTDGEAA